MLSPISLTFQNLLTPCGAKMEFLFYWTMSQMLFVASGVLVMMMVNYLKGSFYRYDKAIAYHEVLWTFLPTIILCSVAVPGMILLYEHEQETEAVMSIKCTGHQWYWSYEYGDFEDVELDSFMVPSQELELGEIRYLEADSRLVVPVDTMLRSFITSSDVIHAFALPVLALKIDATPGRLSTINLLFKSAGVFYGQCSELCGANHSFMPIVLESTSLSLFKEWLNTF